jgi:hypothetical protein
MLEALSLWRTVFDLLSSRERGYSPMPRRLRVILSARKDCGGPIIGRPHGGLSSEERCGAPIPAGGLHGKESSGKRGGALILRELKKKFKGAHQLS